jgi:hypothetical protein
VLDGSKALRKAVRSVFGEVPVQRCLWLSTPTPNRHRPNHPAQRQAWSSGEMGLRWTAAGMLEAEKQFRSERALRRRGARP